MALRPENYSNQPPNVGYYPKYHWKLITLTILGAISVAVVAIVVSLTPVYIGKNEKITKNDVRMRTTYAPITRIQSKITSAELATAKAAIEASYKNSLNAYTSTAYTMGTIFTTDVTWLTLRNYRDLEGLYYSRVFSIAQSLLNTTGTLSSLTILSFQVSVDGSLQESCEIYTNGSTKCTTYDSSEVVATLNTVLTNSSNQALSTSNITDIKNTLEYQYEKMLGAEIASVSISSNKELSAKITWKNLNILNTIQQNSTLLINETRNYLLTNYSYTFGNYSYKVTNNSKNLLSCIFDGTKDVCSFTEKSTINLKEIVKATTDETSTDALKPYVDNIKKALEDLSVVTLATPKWSEIANKEAFLEIAITTPDALTTTQLQSRLDLIYTTVEAAVKATTEVAKFAVKTQEKKDIKGDAQSTAESTQITYFTIIEFTAEIQSFKQ